MSVMDLATFREMLKTELPRLLREHPESRHELVGLMLDTIPSREETNRLLEELRVLREETNRRIEQMDRHLDQVDRHLDQVDQRLDQMDQRFDQVDQRFESLEGRMEAGFEAARRERQTGFETARREREAGFKAVREEMKAGFEAARLDLDRLGSRWGIRSESVFRQTVATLLEKSFGAQVESRTINGEEFDVIVSDGAHILVEIMASAGPKTQERLERKRRLYAQATGVTPARVILATASIHSRRAQALRDAGFEVIEPEEETLE